MAPHQRERKRLAKGPKFSEGTRLFWLAILANGWTTEAAREALGFSRGTVEKLLYGDRSPGREAAGDIERLFGVPSIAWSLAPTEDFDLPKYRVAA